jgi:hypothetical protein
MKILLSALCLFILGICNAQNLPDYNSIPLKTENDFRSAEKAVLKAADYVLSTPIKNLKPDNTGSMAFLIQWMTDTPDFGFNVEANDAVMGANYELIAVYMAAMAKFCLENKEQAKNDEAVKLAVWKMVANYVANPAHNVDMSNKLKKLVAANKDNKMEKFIKDNKLQE